MPSSDLTKRIIAIGLKKLMQTISFSKISVSDITQVCKISRNTFYYHFRDKYDLVNWIFYTEITPVISEMSDITHWDEGLQALFAHMKDNQRFYINAISAQGQNSFSECLTQFYRNLIRGMLEKLSDDIQMTQFEIDVISCFYTHSLIGTILDWVKNGMKQDITPVITVIKHLIDRTIFEKYRN